jgi:hypothetical protein
MPRYSQKERKMVEYGLDDCRCFDGMSVPPVCAVKLLLDRRCLPCHQAANRASAIFAREHRDVQHVILRQEHDNLRAVFEYYQYQYQVHDIENNAIRAAIAAKKHERDELICRRELQHQQE